MKFHILILNLGLFTLLSCNQPSSTNENVAENENMEMPASSSDELTQAAEDDEPVVASEENFATDLGDYHLQTTYGFGPPDGPNAEKGYLVQVDFELHSGHEQLFKASFLPEKLGINTDYGVREPKIVAVDEKRGRLILTFWNGDDNYDTFGAQLEILDFQGNVFFNANIEEGTPLFATHGGKGFYVEGKVVNLDQKGAFLKGTDGNGTLLSKNLLAEKSGNEVTLYKTSDLTEYQSFSCDCNPANLTTGSGLDFKIEDGNYVLFDESNGKKYLIPMDNLTTVKEE
ncbi:MAG: hypothetical protein H6581_07090 [Bacteroidia bacterium]|nr:hypothetical protein [Bacteroidia bacterium]